jgi:predicted dehydrogenase
MEARYRVMIVGMGKRGINHLEHFIRNPNFEVVAVCDKEPTHLREAVGILKTCEASLDALSLAEKMKPDVFCICTKPDIRVELVDIAVKCGARLVALEKPIALNLNEAIKMRRIIDESRTKAVVCHQHRYGAHYQRIKDVITNGELGTVDTIMCISHGWMMHLVSHLMDYMLWYNNHEEPLWVMGQASGRERLYDDHPSPDYIMGVVQFANGVRGVIECGAGAPDIPEVDYFWHKNRIRVIGSLGYAEVVTGKGWRVVSAGGAESGEGCMNYENDMPGYIQQIVDWLEDDENIHPCNFGIAYKGFEMIMGLCRSVVSGGQVALPLIEGPNEIEALRSVISSRAVLASSTYHK